MKKVGTKAKGDFKSEVSPLLVDVRSGSSTSPRESSGEERNRELHSSFREILSISSFVIPKGTGVVCMFLETFAIRLNALSPMACQYLAFVQFSCREQLINQSNMSNIFSNTCIQM